MPRFLETLLQTGGNANFNSAGVVHSVQTPAGVRYQIYVDTALDLVFKKSTDGGSSWSAATTIYVAAVVSFAVWYDRWSNIAAGLIHLAYYDSGADDILYRSIDTENSDTLGTETTIFAGGTTASGGQLSITRARGGNLYCRGCIDAGAEGGFFRSTDVGGTWGSRTINVALATNDQMILLPGWAADNQDIMGFFWSATGNEISRQLNDDSADTWSSTSIATSMTDLVSSTSFPQFAAAVDITNSRNLLAAWSAVDTANADLRCWHITESAITEVTNVVLNSTDDQALCAIGIDTVTGYWYVFYAGKSDGSETAHTLLNFYYKVSKDNGSTWSSEITLTANAMPRVGLYCAPRFANDPCVTGVVNFSVANTNAVLPIIPTANPRTTLILGLH